MGSRDWVGGVVARAPSKTVQSGFGAVALRMIGTGDGEKSFIIDARAARVVDDLIIGARQCEKNSRVSGKPFVRALDFVNEALGWEHLLRGAEELHGVDGIRGIAPHGFAGGGLRPVGLSVAQLCLAQSLPDFRVIAVLAQRASKSADRGRSVALFEELLRAREGIGGGVFPRGPGRIGHIRAGGADGVVGSSGVPVFRPCLVSDNRRRGGGVGILFLRFGGRRIFPRDFPGGFAARAREGFGGAARFFLAFAPRGKLTAFRSEVGAVEKAGKLAVHLPQNSLRVTGSVRREGGFNESDEGVGPGFIISLRGRGEP